MSLKAKECEHLTSFDFEERKVATTYQCDECVKNNDTWVHLRTCQSCGTTLCCDSSPNKHASKHFQEADHGIITSAEPGENWAWCYTDKSYKSYE